jgi:hypothetical protein
MPSRRFTIPAHPQPTAMTADEFYAILEAAGLSGLQASKVLGVGSPTVYNWLNDVTPISAAKAALIREKNKSEPK